jgi:ribosomal protein S21
MGITVTPRGSEGFEVLFRRFIREVQHSRILTVAKKARFKEKDLSRIKKRSIAVRKAIRNKIKRGY